MADDEGKRALLEVEWANFRYQDGLRWSRIQTVGFIEAAILTGAYASPPSINVLVKLAFVFLLSILAAAICALAEKDGRDARSHGARANLLEAELGLPALQRAARVFGVSGYHTIKFCMFVVTLLNILVIAHLGIHALLPLLGHPRPPR